MNAPGIWTLVGQSGSGGNDCPQDYGSSYATVHHHSSMVSGAGLFGCSQALP
jgi:hypothetical protein